MTDQPTPHQEPASIAPMTFGENARAATQLALRKVWKLANRPLASVAWQGGYEGETIISFIPRTAPVAAVIVGIAGTISGIAGQFTGVTLTPESLKIITWSIGIGVASYSFGKYIDTQLDKIKGYVDDAQKRPRFAGSITVGDDIVTASQAATTGRLIHQTGFGIMGMLGVEIRDAKTSKIVNKPLPADNLTEADKIVLIRDYGTMCEHMTLAHREGFEKVNGFLPQNFGDRFLKPIHRAMCELAKETRHHELYGMYRDVQRRELPKATRMLDLYEQKLRKSAKDPAAVPC